MIEIYIFKVESFSETKVWCVAWEHEMDIDQEKKQEREGGCSWERLRLEGMTKEQCGMCGRWQSETKTTSASDDSDEREMPVPVFPTLPIYYERSGPDDAMRQP